MTHAPTTTEIRHPVPPGIRHPRDAEPAARALADRMAAVLGAPAATLVHAALVHVCLAAVNGEAEVVLRIPERTVQ